MTTLAPASAEAEVNFFQRYLIPEESTWVRYSMQRAAHFGTSDNFFYSRIVSVTCAVAAVALSFVKAISYLLQLPFRMLLNVARFNPVRVVTDLVQDITNIARSLLFVSLGVTLVVSGLLFPAAIFSHFSPDSDKAGEERLRYENAQLLDQIKELNAKREEDQQKINEMAQVIRYKQDQLDGNTWLGGSFSYVWSSGVSVCSFVSSSLRNLFSKAGS